MSCSIDLEPNLSPWSGIEAQIKRAPVFRDRRIPIDQCPLSSKADIRTRKKGMSAPKSDTGAGLVGKSSAPQAKIGIVSKKVTKPTAKVGYVHLGGFSMQTTDFTETLIIGGGPGGTGHEPYAQPKRLPEYCGRVAPNCRTLAHRTLGWPSVPVSQLVDPVAGFPISTCRPRWFRHKA
jgi:hypothetical protein